MGLVALVSLGERIAAGSAFCFGGGRHGFCVCCVVVDVLETLLGSMFGWGWLGGTSGLDIQERGGRVKGGNHESGTISTVASQ